MKLPPLEFSLPFFLKKKKKMLAFFLWALELSLRYKKAKSMNGCSNIHFPIRVEWIHFCSRELVSQPPSQLDKAGCYFPANMVPVKG